LRRKDDGAVVLLVMRAVPPVLV